MGSFYTKRFLKLFSIFLITVLATSFYGPQSDVVQPYFLKNASPWADSTLKTLSIDQKIGQLFMIPAYSNKSDAHKKEVIDLIQKYHVGGVLFFQGSPSRQIKLTEEFQKASELPLLIAMDAEWGAAMRLDSLQPYPRAQTLGAGDAENTFNVAKAIGVELQSLGVQMSFAPVLDVNINPENPVINSRSFGEMPSRVGAHGESYFKGLQDAGILAVAKHFPGHGDTQTDSHLDLPVVRHSLDSLKAIDLLPFKRSIDAGIPGVLVGHLSVPALEKSTALPASLSKQIINNQLIKELNFNGIVVSDAMNMKAVTKYYKAGHAELQALLAGNDIILFPDDLKASIIAIKSALRKKKILESELDEHVLKILKAKESLGLTGEFKSVRKLSKHNLAVNELSNRNAFASAVTLLINENNLLPLKGLSSTRLVSVAIGNEKENYPFQDELAKFGRIKTYQLPKKPSSFDKELVFKELTEETVVLVSLHNTKQSPSTNFGITNETVDFIKELAQKTKVAVVHFGNPYALETLNDKAVSALVVGYEEHLYAQQYAAEGIFGAIEFKGKLPVTINQKMQAGSGIETERVSAFHFTVPEAVGINSVDLTKVDSIARFGIKEQAYPGCQILIAKDEQVIYNKAFGYHTYENISPVLTTDLYDLASITKIASTVASCMYLDDLGLFSTEKTLGDYIPEITKETAYNDIRIKDMLTHRAGLRSWIPFYQYTMSKGVPRYDVYSLGESEMYPYRVAENFYIHKNYPDSIVNQILSTPLHEKKEYRYSDLGYYFLQLIVEKQSGVPLEQFVDSVFYKPMGLSTTGYLPLKRFDKARIVPTEYDLYFRKQLIHGDVHDPGAAMNGGVGGHAGLFSNATDLAKIMQLFLTGEYQGVRFFSDSVLTAYTTCLYCKDPEIDNRRGLGFDKPVTEGDGGPTCSCISLASFGHTGFTGTIAWADPDEDIVYIFLSNRVYPDAQNKKLIKLGIRTDIMQAIYDANENAKLATE